MPQAIRRVTASQRSTTSAVSFCTNVVKEREQSDGLAFAAGQRRSLPSRSWVGARDLNVKHRRRALSLGLHRPAHERVSERVLL